MDPKLFGRYQIVRKLAGGGMGRVFLAYDPVMGRQFGLKLIDAGGDRDSLDVIAAERRGATLQDQLAKRETSGRVAQIFDVGEREGYFYIAMEYIEGEDLSELVARGPLEPERAVGIALDVLDVLVKSHTFQTVIEGRAHRGIIHGDIKPRNIRITTAGQVKVLDFGIAKAVSMTRSVTFNQFGSVPYSSPERLQTGDMDAKSDVWSVAVVLFEMLTGMPYFQAEAPSKLEWTIRNYKSPEPSLAKIQPGLREILSRALDPDLNKRFGSAAAFESALYEWRRFAVAGPRPAPEDPDATRRTAFQNPDEHTRRSSGPQPKPTPVVKPVPVAPAAQKLNVGGLRLGKTTQRVIAGVVVAMFLFGVFSVVYAFRTLGNANSLARQVDSGQLSVEAGAVAYQELAAKTWFQTLLFPLRSSLRERYVAEADRVMADYREESASTPVNLRAWQQAAAALKKAVEIAPEDKSIRGKSKIATGYLNLLHRPKYLQTARENFEEAVGLLPRGAPDAHLGLAQFYMADGDLDKAEEELKLAQSGGFSPGQRRRRDLADAYLRRGEKYMTAAQKAHDIGKMQEALQLGDSDLAHAQELYKQLASFPDGVKLADQVSADRAQLARTLAESKLATDGPKENP
jgi:serine/threonine protein kinase